MDEDCPEEPRRTPREIADRTELAAFAGFLSEYVESRTARDELAVATVHVARMAEELRIDAITIVAAVELITGSLLQQTDELSPGRVDRYTEAMTALIRSLFRGP